MNIIDVISRFLLLATMCPQRYPLTWLIMGLAMILTLALLILLVMILFKLFWEL